MEYTITEIIFFFIFYSFAGWCLETVFAAASKKKFLNRGFLNGIICPSYGIAMILIIFLFEPGKEGIFFMFVASTVVATMVEYFTASFAEKFLKKKYWDYSKEKFQLAGRICLKFSLSWGILATITVEFVQPLLTGFIRFIDFPIIIIFIWGAFGIALLDFAVTISAIIYGKHQSKEMKMVASRLRRNSKKLSLFITRYVEKRLNKAYSIGDQKDIVDDMDKTVFAYGCGFHKLLWLFMIGAFLGDIVETIFCYFTTGTLMSRSSVIYGPFSIVWGFGIVLFTPVLYRFRDMDDRHVFAAGTVLGGVYEYACSVFTEVCFGTVFWDYSDIPFNLGGRINLLYCFFWGIAALTWVKLCYPFLSGIIEKIPKRVGCIISYIMLAFMIINMMISTAALVRYDERVKNIAADNQVREFLDRHYDDALIEKIYPNAIHK